jgi:hypothetical protein
VTGCAQTNPRCRVTGPALELAQPCGLLTGVKPTCEGGAREALGFDNKYDSSQ